MINRVECINVDSTLRLVQQVILSPSEFTVWYYTLSVSSHVPTIVTRMQAKLLPTAIKKGMLPNGAELTLILFWDAKQNVPEGARPQNVLHVVPSHL